MLANTTFVAIDFETADHQPDSACAVALVRVENLQIVRKALAYIRPPRERIVFTHIHGITWEMVAAMPRFCDAWPKLLPLLDGAKHLIAHNAGFDRNVLRTCCALARLPAPRPGFLCTVQLARKAWGQRRNDLASVCARLGIALQHHDPLSDAEACAQIAIAAQPYLKPSYSTFERD